MIKQSLLQCTENSFNQFSYIIDISTLWINWIPLKQIALCARTCRPETNRVLYTQDGQFALCADKTKNAKELQQQFWLQWWWDTTLIQWKDEKIKKIIS
jgi:hypothetical protein